MYSTECLIGRKREVENLKTLLTNKEEKPWVAVVGLRATGKTTLVRSVINEIDKDSELYIDIELLKDSPLFQEDPLKALAYYLLVVADVRGLLKDSAHRIFFTPTEHKKSSKKTAKILAKLLGPLLSGESELQVEIQKLSKFELNENMICLSNVLLHLKTDARVFFDEIQHLTGRISTFAEQLRGVFQTPKDPSDKPWIIISGSVITAIKPFIQASAKDAFYLQAFEEIKLDTLSVQDSIELLKRCLIEKGVLKKRQLQDKTMRELVESLLTTPAQELGGFPRALVAYCEKIKTLNDLNNKDIINNIKSAVKAQAIEELRHIAMMSVVRADQEREKVSTLTLRELFKRIKRAYNEMGTKGAFKKSLLIKTHRIPKDIAEYLIDALKEHKIISEIYDGYSILDPLYREAMVSINIILTKDIKKIMKVEHFPFQ
ncbi:ATP-binding protein [Thermococcus chitonophagus]|uniref:hypothetical protein n=1 Tax=Thermococcus chitonophagus TaxID=54262 RepID=UPI0012EDC89A|nr:hypothetical protein [Thermococcus chitonophagus]